MCERVRGSRLTHAHPLHISGTPLLALSDDRVVPLLGGMQEGRAPSRGGGCDSSSGTCVSCIPNGDSLCLADSDCCSGLCETYYGICGCGIAGSDCLRNEDCCLNICTTSG